MYNMTVHAQQVLGASLCAVSLTETDDQGFTYPIATAMSSSNLLASAEEDPLWVFLQQIRDALSRALGDETGLWFQVQESAAMDGGWRGAGNPGQTERSEDDRA
jgi:hypothetical protein